MTVLFDLDGTLVDSEPGIVSSWRHTISTLGLPEHSDAELRALIGPPLLDLSVAMTDDVALQRSIVSTYLAHYDSIGLLEATVYAGIEPLLDALHQQEHTLAVATSKSESIARQMLETFGLAHHFAFIGGALRDGTRHHKHDVIEHVLGSLDEGPMMMVGDRLHDVRGARVHGIDCIGVLWGYGSEAELLGAGAVAVVERPDELPALLVN
jgi:phosphoglycolate phosphatase